MTLEDRIKSLAPFVVVPRDAGRVPPESTIFDVGEYLERAALFEPGQPNPVQIRVGLTEQNKAALDHAAGVGGYVSIGAFNASGAFDPAAVAALGLMKPVMYHEVVRNAWDAMSAAAKARVPQLRGLFRECAVVSYSCFFPAQAGAPLAAQRSWEGRWSTFSVLLHGASFTPLAAGFHGTTPDPASPNGVRLVAWDAIDLTEDVGAVARPVVYVAKGTNTFYEKPGRYPIETIGIITSALTDGTGTTGFGENWQCSPDGTQCRKSIEDEGDCGEALLILGVLMLGSCIAGAASAGTDTQTGTGSAPPDQDQELTPIDAETPLDPYEIPLLADTVPRDGKQVKCVGPFPFDAMWWGTSQIRWGVAQLSQTQTALLEPGRARGARVQEFLDALSLQRLPFTLG